MSDFGAQRFKEELEYVDLEVEDVITTRSGEDKIPVHKYLFARFLSMPGSIFLDGLVGGMFLSFLLEDEDSCEDKNFTRVFFTVGLSHFLCHILQSLADYAERALSVDAEVSTLEVIINWTTWVLLHLGRVVQFPMVLALGYYAIKFDLLEKNQWTYSKERKEELVSMQYCDRNYVHLAQITFIFQVIIGFILVSLWVIMWAVDSEDDEDELRQERAWKQFEKNMNSKWWGHVYVTFQMIGSQSFFHSGVTGAMLALAIALPPENCHMAMKNFLIGGLIEHIIGAVNDIQVRVEEMAYLDGIINWIEYGIIQFLKFLHFPLFIVEFYCFIEILREVSTSSSTVTHNKEEGGNYCAKGTWQFMLAITGIYSIVFFFKVFVIIAMLIERFKKKK